MMLSAECGFVYFGTVQAVRECLRVLGVVVSVFHEGMGVR